jgi:nucleoside-diphosphate-sugar epimerase
MTDTALIGHTGFIGSNLKTQIRFSSLYNSKNIDDIVNREFDCVVSCGNSSLKWYANKNSNQDYENILSFIERMKTVKTRRFVLMSTIDVYENPYDVTEYDVADCTDKIPYGKNRLILENFVREFFKNHLIIRLPVVYGHGFKKNLIFDALNNNGLEKINGNTQVQIYNIDNIGSDIQNFTNKKLKTVNLATEPFVVNELFEDVFGITLSNFDEVFSRYDMKTAYSESGDYFYSKERLTKELIAFKEQYELKCM